MKFNFLGLPTLIAVYWLIFVGLTVASSFEEESVGRHFFSSLYQYPEASHIMSVNADGSDPQTHTIIGSQVTYFTFSSYSMKAIFMANKDLHIMELNTFNQTAMIPDMNCYGLDISNNGKRAACLRFDNKHYHQIILIDLESLQQKLFFESKYIKSFKLSSNGSTIWVMTKELLEHPKLFEINLDNPEEIVQKYEFTFSDFAWSSLSPDCGKIILLDNTQKLLLITIETGTILTIPTKHEILIPMSWSSDMAFVYLEYSASPGGSDLIVLNTENLSYNYVLDSNGDIVKTKRYGYRFN